MNAAAASCALGPMPSHSCTRAACFASQASKYDVLTVAAAAPPVLASAALPAAAAALPAGLDPYLESHSSQPPQVVSDLIQASLSHDWKAVHAHVGAGRLTSQAGTTVHVYLSVPACLKQAGP